MAPSTGPSLQREPEITWHGLRTFVVHQALRSRSTWRTTLISGVASPVFFLLALGLGLGSLVTDKSGLGTDDYIGYVGPGLLATAAMQHGGNQSLWPTLGALKWEGNYQAALLTPLTAAELATGHILWIGARLLVSSTLFAVVLVGFGAVESFWGLLAPLAATLLGLVYAAVLSSWSASRDGDGSFAIIVRVLLFMFLFSGAFYPIEQLPDGLELVARLTPIWHGVELCRNLTSGAVGTSDLLRILYLGFLLLIGWRLSLRSFRNRLAP